MFAELGISVFSAGALCYPVGLKWNKSHASSPKDPKMEEN
jgi:hypothetical protein